MSLSSTPRPLSLRHCLTVPTAVAEGTGHAPDPSPRSADDAPPRLRARVRHPQPAAALGAIVSAESRVATTIPRPAPLAPPAPPAVPGVAYDLCTGDTLAAVAHSHGVELDVLLAANDLDAASILYVGERILIPDARTRAGRPSAATV